MHIDNNADIPCGHLFTVMTQTALEDMRARTINNTRTLKENVDSPFILFKERSSPISALYELTFEISSTIIGSPVKVASS